MPRVNASFVISRRLDKAHRFIALRYIKKRRRLRGKARAISVFDTPEYSYRVFVTNMNGGIALLSGSTISGRMRKTSSRKPKTMPE